MDFYLIYLILFQFEMKCNVNWNVIRARTSEICERKFNSTEKTNECERRDALFLGLSLLLTERKNVGTVNRTVFENFPHILLFYNKNIDWFDYAIGLM